MKNLKNYLKYYLLEDYLFNEVSINLQDKKSFLRSEDFIAIVIWKSLRTKGRVKKSKISAENIKEVHSIISNISLENPSTQKEDIKKLDDLPLIGIPMASAFLTVRCSEYFTVVDIRAKTSLAKYITDKEDLNDKEVRSKFKDLFGADPASSPKAYLEYCEYCRNEARRIKVSLRNFDRMLWGYDFYRDLKKLAEKIK